MSVPIRPARALPQDSAHTPDEFFLTLLTRFFCGVFSCRPPTDRYHWSPQKEHTKILVTASTPIDRQVVGKLPAVAIVPGPFQAVPMGIGDVAAYTASSSRTSYHYLYTGYYAVYTIGSTPAEATFLARECERALLAERPLLEGRGGFHQIARPGCSINPPSSAGELVPGDADGAYMVQMSVPAYWQYTSDVTPVRESASRRTIAQVMGQDRAQDYPYQGIHELATATLRIAEQDVVVRVLQGSPPGTVRIQPGERTLSQSALLPHRREEG